MRLSVPESNGQQNYVSGNTRPSMEISLPALLSCLYLRKRFERQVWVLGLSRKWATNTWRVLVSMKIPTRKYVALRKMVSDPLQGLEKSSNWGIQFCIESIVQHHDFIRVWMLWKVRIYTVYVATMKIMLLRQIFVRLCSFDCCLWQYCELIMTPRLRRNDTLYATSVRCCDTTSW